MAQRWPAPNVKPKLSQEEFDDAVKTNIEDFDMTAEEAVKSAVDEFTLQGYDLSCVVKTAAGGELAQHPINVATEALSQAGEDPSAIASAVSQLATAVEEACAAGPSGVQEASAVALKAGSLREVIKVLKALSKQEGASAQALLPGLQLAKRLMAGSLDIRDTFDDFYGPELVLDLHKAFLSDLDFQAELASLAECSAFREEQNKERLVDLGYAVSLLGLLTTTTTAGADSAAAAAGDANGGAALPTALVVGACGVLRAVTTADDDRPPSSKAFMTARLLARQHQALRVLLGLLKGQLAAAGGASQLAAHPDKVEAVAAVLSAVRQLAANEEICKDFMDEGGVTACLTCLKALAGKQREAVRCGLGALRQLAHSDGTKRLLSEHDGASLLLGVSAAHHGDEEVTEAVLGVMANMTLRQPEAVERCAQAGVVEWVLETQAALPAAGPVQRSAAILTRNMVVRNPELRPVFLEKGAEALLRAAKKAHPKSCTDVGSAALRDLGLDNYNS